MLHRVVGGRRRERTMQILHDIKFGIVAHKRRLGLRDLHQAILLYLC